MEEVIGKLKVVLFHNEENLYSVIKILVSDETDNKFLTLTGNFPIPNETSEYRYKGEYFKHPKFGNQFIVSEYEELLPNSKETIIKYLSSPLFSHIGVKTATKIYDALGDDSIEKIKNNNDILDGIVTDEQKKTITAVLKSSTYFDDAVKMFVTYGVSIKTLLKIQSVYKDQMINVIKDNPYQMIEDIDGIGFKTADELAMKLGFNEVDEKRIKACLIYCVNTICFNESNTYTDVKAIVNEFKKYIFKIDNESVFYYIDMLILEGKLIKEEDKIFSKAQYIAEKENARILSKFIKRTTSGFHKDLINNAINKLEMDLNIVYDESQKEAIYKCINSGLTIITGGPGTGKTTIVNAIIKIYNLLIKDSEILVCAPTGRASKRLTDITGVKATTIHSLLKWDLHSNVFSVNENNPLQGDLLIVDEFSMVDNYLFHQLLRSSENIGQIILIGDEDQLPSVAPGDVLKNLIESGVINTIKLTKIYRQSEMSNIINLAHLIKNNDIKEDVFSNDVTFYSASDYKIRDIVLEYIKIAKNNGYEDDDIQVLAPMYQGMNGIDNFNDMLQQYFNPYNEELDEIRIGRSIYRVNDKILQLKNQNDDNVYNGDIGNLIEIEKSNIGNKLYVDFDGNYVEYTNKDFINITHAYCISVHKSQGSEYPLIILPISFSYQKMLAKNLIYTAVTRAKKKLIIIGNYDAFLYGIKNSNYKIRNTTLKEKLLKCVNLQ